MPKLLGCLPSPDDCLGLGPLMGLELTTGPLPSEADEPLPAALDQQFQDCVAHASAVAICHGQWVAAGRPSAPWPLVAAWPELASRAWLYALARLKGGQTLLDDAGSYIWALFDSVAKLGFPRESEWSYGPHHLSAMPDWSAARGSADQKLVNGARRIVSTGDRRVLDVATAIAGGSVVVLGTRLDAQFSDLSASDVWPGLRGPSRGGHAMLGHRFRTVPSTGRKQFGLRSSWGSGYADNGTAWVDEDAIASPNMSDLWLVDLAPQYSE